MKIKVIKTESDYEEALAELRKFMSKGISRTSDETREMEVLMLVIEDYERRIGEPPGDIDPIEAIKFRMEQQPLSPKDLVPYIGSRSKVSEVLSGKRKLSHKMIQNLHRGLGIPLESLYRVTPGPKARTGTSVEKSKAIYRAQEIRAKKKLRKPAIRRAGSAARRRARRGIRGIK